MTGLLRFGKIGRKKAEAWNAPQKAAEFMFWKIAAEDGFWKITARGKPSRAYRILPLPEAATGKGAEEFTVNCREFAGVFKTHSGIPPLPEEFEIPRRLTELVRTSSKR